MIVTYVKQINGFARLCSDCSAHSFNMEMSHFSCELGYAPRAFRRPDNCPIKPRSMRELSKIKSGIS